MPSIAARRFPAGAAVAALMAAHPSAASAQEAVDADVVAAIIADVRERSEVADLFHTLTDVLGPRLSGSPAYDRAAQWAVGRFEAWGLADVRLEPFEFGRGWTLDALTVEMIAPRYMPLTGYAEGWSPPTNGVLTGTPVYVGDSTADEIAALGDRLRDAIVLTARPQTEFLSEDRPQPAGDIESVPTGNPPFPTPSSAAPRAELVARLDALGAGVALSPGPTEHGTVRVQGNRNTSPDGTPSVVLAAEQYNLLVRMVQAGLPVELRVAVEARYDEESLDSYNVFAEIPGSDPTLRDEIVLIGAHLDSWHTATGATDNADGVAAVMETMRVLATLDAAPRRTIRAALWGGEEQGLLGSRAWVARHLAGGAGRARVAVYLNDDPGTGKTYGFYMEQSEAAKEIFDAWLEPLRELGVRRNVIEGIDSTDHVPFVQLGVPAFTAIKEFRNYDVRTRHTNVDFADAVDVEDLRQSAIVMAVMAWHAAMRDEPIPRLPAASAGAGLPAASAGAAAAAEPVPECADLERLGGAGVTIETAAIVPAEAVAGRPSVPEHCMVQGVIDARVGADGKPYGVGFDLRMPTDWNGRFVFQGGGGLDGVLNPASGDIFGTLDPSALARGFAVVSTDGGHRSASMIDASFALDQQARVDYAFNAMDKATQKGKELVQLYYGKAPDYAYLLGCSNGGRQGLMAAQRFPLHFDGIVAGNPAFKLTRIAMNQTSNIQIIASIAPRNEQGRPILARAFDVAQLEAAGDAILVQCDALDGLADGMINDWRACDFDPAELSCSVNDADTCLTDPQVDALSKLHRGPVDREGRPLYGQFVYDTGLAGPAWRRMRMGTATDGTWNASDVALGFETLRQYAMTPPDPELDPMTFDFDVDPARTEQMRALGDADATYLETFRQTGKMIVYHGNSDEGMATGALTDWYDAVLADNGEDITDAVRLFLVPGMTHCGGGMSTDQFDMLDAIQGWVEQDSAPDRIIATGDQFPGVSRPLCPYPLVARYQGGDPDDAASFACLP